MTHDAVKQVDELCAAIGALLAGQPPAVQGAALADLTAMWIAGHHPSLRGPVLEHHDEVVAQLIEVNAQTIADNYNLPDWAKQKGHS